MDATSRMPLKVRQLTCPLPTVSHSNQQSSRLVFSNEISHSGNKPKTIRLFRHFCEGAFDASRTLNFAASMRGTQECSLPALEAQVNLFCCILYQFAGHPLVLGEPRYANSVRRGDCLTAKWGRAPARIVAQSAPATKSHEHPLMHRSSQARMRERHPVSAESSAAADLYRTASAGMGPPHRTVNLAVPLSGCNRCTG